MKKRQYRLLARKIFAELCEAETHEDVVWEVADLLYFMSVLMYKENVTWKDVCDELDIRHKEK